MRYREMRFPCDTEVAILADGASHRARLVNVSATGAKIAWIGRPVAREAQVTLLYLSVRLPARVVWAAGPQAGLRFALPLSTWDLSALRRDGGRGISRGSSRGGGPDAAGRQGFRELT